MADVGSVITGVIRAVIMLVAGVVLLLVFPWLLPLGLLICLFIWPLPTLAVGTLLVMIGMKVWS